MNSSLKQFYTAVNLRNHSVKDSLKESLSKFKESLLAFAMKQSTQCMDLMQIAIVSITFVLYLDLAHTHRVWLAIASYIYI